MGLKLSGLSKSKQGFLRIGVMAASLRGVGRVDDVSD